MSATIVRLILSTVLMIAMPALYMTIALFFKFSIGLRIDDMTMFLIANFLCGAFLVVAWLLIWRSEVRWTPRRINLTVMSLFAALVPAAVMGSILEASIPLSDGEAGVIFAAMIWALTWIPMTVFCWRETKAERADRLRMMGINAIACPTCGYNLTGLREASCPECGSRFTLDQIVASLSDRDKEVKS